MLPPGAFTMVVLPDTQSYLSGGPSINAILSDQARWIVEHKDSHNIRFVLHEGDIVDGMGLDLEQWRMARAAMDNLNGEVFYAMAPGNHDYEGGAASRFTYFNDDRFFGPNSPYGRQETVGGFFEANRTDNSYHVFRAGENDWLVLALGFGPSDQLVEWTDNVISAHPNHTVILLTHAYLYSDDTRYDWIAKGSSQSWNPHRYTVARRPGETVNDGQELWDKLLRKHANVKLVFCGHVLNDGVALLTSVGDRGQVIHQMLANYQTGVEGSINGGNGFMRLIYISPDGTLDVYTYSPHLDELLSGPYQHFRLEVSPLKEEERPRNLSLLLEEAESLLGQLPDRMELPTALRQYEEARFLAGRRYFFTAKWILEVKVIPFLERLAGVSKLFEDAQTAVELARESGVNPLVIESIEKCLAGAQERLNQLDTDGAVIYLEQVCDSPLWRNISSTLPLAEEIVQQLEAAKDRRGLMAKANYDRALQSLDRCEPEAAQRYLVRITAYLPEPTALVFIMPFLLQVVSPIAALRARRKGH